MPDVDRTHPSQFDAAVIDAAQAMSETTPHPCRVRVSGRLDLMGVSQGVIKIHVASGAVVTALWEGKDPIDELRLLSNRNVVCEGTGVFRSFGTLLRIDADAIAEAQARDAGFAVAPRAAVRVTLPASFGSSLARPRLTAKLLCSVPVEESDEDLAAAIEAMS